MSINHFFIFIIFSLSLVKNSQAAGWTFWDGLSFDKIFCGAPGPQRQHSIDEIKLNNDLSDDGYLQYVSPPTAEASSRDDAFDVEMGIPQSSKSVKKSDVFKNDHPTRSTSRPKASKSKIIEKEPVDLEMGFSQINRSSREEETNPYPEEKRTTFQSNRMTWIEKMSGEALSIFGIPIASAGGILVFSYPNLSHFLGKLGFGLVPLALRWTNLGSFW